MAYHVQAEIRRVNTIYVGWFECSEILSGKFEEGFTLQNIWPNTILMDKKGVADADLRSITIDDVALGFRKRLMEL